MLSKTETASVRAVQRGRASLRGKMEEPMCNTPCSSIIVPRDSEVRQKNEQEYTVCVMAARHHTMRSPRVGSFEKKTAGSAGVGVRSWGGLITKHITKAMTGAKPSRMMRAAQALSTTRA